MNVYQSAFILSTALDGGKGRNHFCRRYAKGVLEELESEGYIHVSTLKADQDKTFFITEAGMALVDRYYGAGNTYGKRD